MASGKTNSDHSVTIYHHGTSLHYPVQQGEEPLLVVGTDPHNQRWSVIGDYVAATLHAERIPYRRTPQRSWVRNDWVYFPSTKTYLPAQHHNVPYHPTPQTIHHSLLGDGGRVVGEQSSFMLLSQACDLLYPEQVQRLLEALSAIPTYTVPFFPRETSDIDLVVCPIPFARKLVMDQAYFQQEQRTLERIAEAENADIIVTEEKYAPNCIVLDTPKAQCVITYAAPRFASQLRMAGIPVVEVRGASIDHLCAGGGARCATNVVHPSVFSEVASRSLYAPRGRRPVLTLDELPDVKDYPVATVKKGGFTASIRGWFG